MNGQEPSHRGSPDRGNGRGRWWEPAPPRRVQHERAWNVGFRTVHLGAFGVLLGGHFWGIEPERLLPALGIAVASGAGLMGLELYKSLHWLFLVKGWLVLGKLALLLAVPLVWEARVPLLFGVLVLAAVGAHMPGRYRNYSMLHRRVIGGEPALPLALTGPRPPGDVWQSGGAADGRHESALPQGGVRW